MKGPPRYPGLALLDADVCLYAAMPASTAHPACAWVMREIAYRRLNAAIDVEVIREILSRLGRVGQWDKAYVLVESLLQIVPIHYPVNARDIRLAATLARMQETQRLRLSGCIHLAIMQHHGLNVILSMDTAYDAFPEITRLDPLKLYEGRAAGDATPRD